MSLDPDLKNKFTLFESNIVDLIRIEIYDAFKTCHLNENLTFTVFSEIFSVISTIYNFTGFWINAMAERVRHG